MRPPPGRDEGTIDTVTVAGAVPLRGVALSHFPSSEVDTDAIQLNEPKPAFLTCRVWAGGVPPAVKKLKLPGKLSKYGALPGETTVNVTGTVSAIVLLGYSK